jgi:hypothetical protein
MKPSVEIYKEIFNCVAKNGTLKKNKMIDGVGDWVQLTHIISFHNQPVTFRVDIELPPISECGFTRVVVTTHTLFALVNGQ